MINIFKTKRKFQNMILNLKVYNSSPTIIRRVSSLIVIWKNFFVGLKKNSYLPIFFMFNSFYLLSFIEFF